MMKRVNNRFVTNVYVFIVDLELFTPTKTIQRENITSIFHLQSKVNLL